MHNMKYILALFLSLSFLSPAAHAENDGVLFKKVAIVSLIGDALTIDIYRQRVRTLTESNHQEVVPLSKPVFDHAALLAAKDAIAKVVPTASVAPLAVPGTGSDADPARLLGDTKALPSNPLIAALRQDGFTHLLVIAKHRAAARMQLASGAVGSGYVQGLGFYIDNYLRTEHVETREQGTGIIAPYIYIKLALVDLHSLSVKGEEVITANTIRSARNAEDLDPWSSMTSEEKVAVLKELLQERITAAVPLLFRSK
jgi:hypothetical protein